MYYLCTPRKESYGVLDTLSMFLFEQAVFMYTSSESQSFCRKVAKLVRCREPQAKDKLNGASDSLSAFSVVRRLKFTTF